MVYFGLHHIGDPTQEAVRYPQATRAILQTCSNCLGFARDVELDFAQWRFDGSGFLG